MVKQDFKAAMAGIAVSSGITRRALDDQPDDGSLHAPGNRRLGHRAEGAAGDGGREWGGVKG